MRGAEVSKPKLLFFDIESIGVNALKADLGRVVMFGYKTNLMYKPRVEKMTKAELRNFDDKPLLERITSIYQDCELSIGHYAAPFDRRFLQGRLLINNMPPLPPTRLRDTCLILRSVANFSSNRLGYAAKILNLAHRKTDNNWPEAWFKVMQGNMQHLKAMAEYCAHDVLAVEDLYYRIRPFDNAHPRMFEDQALCRKCGSAGQLHGVAWHAGKKYHRFQCNACGGWDRLTVRAA